MKVSELTGVELDSWVAKALHWKTVMWGGRAVWIDMSDAGRFRSNVEDWHPSTDWSQGGPIIEREHIKLKDGMFEKWSATSKAPNYKYGMEGPTALIAAMRAFVASRFGLEVDDSQAGE